MARPRSIKRKATDSDQPAAKKRRTKHDEDSTPILSKLNKNLRKREAINPSLEQARATRGKGHSPQSSARRLRHQARENPNASTREGRREPRSITKETSEEAQRYTQHEMGLNERPEDQVEDQVEDQEEDQEEYVPDEALRRNSDTIQADFERDIKISHDHFEQHPDDETAYNDILRTECAFSSITVALDRDPLRQVLLKMNQTCWKQVSHKQEKEKLPKHAHKIVKYMIRYLERIRRFIMAALNSPMIDQQGFYQRHAQHLGYIFAALDQSIDSAEGQNMHPIPDWSQTDWKHWGDLTDDIALIVFPTSIRILQQAWPLGGPNGTGFSIDTINILTQCFHRSKRLYNEVLRRFERRQKESERQKRNGDKDSLVHHWKKDIAIHERRQTLEKKLARLSQLLEDGTGKVHNEARRIETAKAWRQAVRKREEEYRRREREEKQRSIEQQSALYKRGFRNDIRNAEASQQEPGHETESQPRTRPASSVKGSVYASRLLESWTPEAQNLVILEIDKSYPHMPDCIRIAQDLEKGLDEVEAMVRWLLPFTLQYIFPNMSATEVQKGCKRVLQSSTEA